MTQKLHSDHAQTSRNNPLPALVRFGADSKTDLVQNIRQILSRFYDKNYENDQNNIFETIIKDSNQTIAHMPVRLALATSSQEQLLSQLERTLKYLEKEKGKRLLAGNGIFIHLCESSQAAQEEKGLLAMLFPGQGAQSIGMFAELASVFPIIHQTFEEANEILKKDLEKPLTEYIWPTQCSPEEATEALTQTVIAQPALLTCNVALLRFFKNLGIEPHHVAGHSLGEYAACVASSVMDFPHALRAVAARGRAMSEATPPGIDPGWMAAIGAPLEVIEKVLQEIEGYVIPANKNCHAQTIIAGTSKVVEKAMERFEEEGYQTIRLPVSHAFHTQIVEPACLTLQDVLKKIPLKAPLIPIFSNVTGENYPQENNSAEIIINLLSQQVASPVEFIAEIENMYSQGARTFLEIGPRRTLTTFVGNILGKKPHQAIATNNPKKGDIHSLFISLAALIALGYEIKDNLIINSSIGVSGVAK